ncbi:MAG: type III-A CRISPR-associated protein Csm2 [Deltaproteobacteria bacterium]|nr:type III-A CRISPR-associated protein Csm2 [Deltaproteobacteria bacterium]MBW2122752.1 type III-A CRISPR-associated protein Csm2 [Deltaproteobacteria bacterium]
MERNDREPAIPETMNFYDPDGSIRQDLFSVVAERQGRALVQRKSEKRKGGRGTVEITPTQVRRFFDEVKGIQRYLNQFQPEERESAFRRKLPEIMMLKAKVTYARGRDALTDEFKGFIEKSVASIKNLRDFEVFCKFFEAVYGYFYYYSPKKD